MDFRIFAISMVLMFISTGTVFASTSLISVQTDDDNYDEGDTIVISGESPNNHRRYTSHITII